MWLERWDRERDSLVNGELSEQNTELNVVTDDDI